jgi:sugar O-acyltransferase (sialic acid O-acetyltransferase NeuD family)
MKNLLIIGARGWGREIFNMLPHCMGYGTEYVVKGFLDDKTDALDGMAGYPPIIDSVEHYTPQQDDVFTCALGDADWKKHYVEIILKKGGEFINVIHNTATIGRNTIIGTGCIFCEYVSISCDIVVKDFVTIQSNANVGHDARVDNYCHLGVRAFMGGGSHLGDVSTIQTSAIVLPKIRVGTNCMVGAGAVVIKKVKDGETVYGNPARKL